MSVSSLDRFLDRIEAWKEAKDSLQPVILTSTDPQVLEATVTTLAQRVFCSTNCGSCSACTQIAAQTHPAVHIVSPEDRTLRITDVRRVILELSQRSSYERRVVAISLAHTLTLPASQALLKTLENMPRDTLFILSTVYARRLLPTIRSRCITLRIPHVASTTTENMVPEWLQKGSQQKMPRELSLDDLFHLGEALIDRVRTDGATPELLRSLQRLRDYHVMSAQPGNERAARDMLLAGLSR